MAEEVEIDYEDALDQVQGEDTFDAGQIKVWEAATKDMRSLAQLMFFANRRPEIKTSQKWRARYLELNEARRALKTVRKAAGLEDEEKIKTAVLQLLVDSEVEPSAWSAFLASEKRAAGNECK